MYKFTYMYENIILRRDITQQRYSKQLLLTIGVIDFKQTVLQKISNFNKIY